MADNILGAGATTITGSRTGRVQNAYNNPSQNDLQSSKQSKKNPRRQNKTAEPSKSMAMNSNDENSMRGGKKSRRDNHVETNPSVHDSKKMKSSEQSQTQLLATPDPGYEAESGNYRKRGDKKRTRNAPQIQKMMSEEPRRH